MFTDFKKMTRVLNWGGDTSWGPDLSDMKMTSADISKHAATMTKIPVNFTTKPPQKRLKEGPEPDKKWKKTERDRTQRTRGIKDKRLGSREPTAPQVLDLAKFIFNSKSSDWDLTQGTVGRGRSVIGLGQNYEKMHSLWENFVVKKVATSAGELAELMCKREGATQKAMNKFSYNVRAGMLDKGADESEFSFDKKRKKPDGGPEKAAKKMDDDEEDVEEADEESEEDPSDDEAPAPKKIQTPPDELSHIVTEMASRATEMNLHYDRFIANAAADSKKFQDLYDENKVEKAKQAQQLGELQQQLQQSQQAGSQMHGQLTNAAARLQQIDAEKAELIHQGQRMERAHAQALETGNQYVHTLDGELKKQGAAHVDALASISSERAQERDNFKSAQDRALEELRATHQQERSRDHSTNQALLDELRRNLTKEHRDEQERLEAVHRDAERHLVKQVDDSKGGFATERADMERTHRGALDEGARRLRALEIEKEQALNKTVEEGELASKAHVAQLAQIERELDASKGDQAELQQKLKIAEDRTERELSLAKQQYEDSQRGELEKQKRELVEQHDLQIASARTETERAVLHRKESELADKLASGERETTGRIQAMQQQMDQKLELERTQKSSETAKLTAELEQMRKSHTHEITDLQKQYTTMSVAAAAGAGGGGGPPRGGGGGPDAAQQLAAFTTLIHQKDAEREARLQHEMIQFKTGIEQQNQLYMHQLQQHLVTGQSSLEQRQLAHEAVFAQQANVFGNQVMKVAGGGTPENPAAAAPQPQQQQQQQGGDAAGGSGRAEIPQQATAVIPGGGDDEMSEVQEPQEEKQEKQTTDQQVLKYPKSKFNRNYTGAHGRRLQLPLIKGGFSKNLYMPI